jgi:putative transcriptional regulator
MSKTSTTQVTVKPGEPLPTGDTDWEYLDAMSEEDLIQAALSDPDAQPTTEEDGPRFKRVSRVKLLRQRLGMTQADFAAAYQLPLGTLRDWEQHRSSPDAPARALLRAIEQDPETMRRLLQSAA